MPNIRDGLFCATNHRNYFLKDFKRIKCCASNLYCVCCLKDSKVKSYQKAIKKLLQMNLPLAIVLLVVNLMDTLNEVY